MPAICRYYNTPAGCRYGKRCRYEHVTDTRPTSQRPCHFFRTSTGCRNGSHCRFSHAQPATQLSQSSAPLQGTSSVGRGDAKELPVVVDDLAKNMENLTADDSKAVVLYDPEVAAENLAEAAIKNHFLPERKRRPGSELEMAQCGVCRKKFNSAPSPEASAVALHEHYIEKLGKSDYTHLKFFRDHYGFIEEEINCLICDKSFRQFKSLFRHLKAKMADKKNPAVAKQYKHLFEDILRPFVERDTGFEIADDEIVGHLKTLLTDDSFYLSSDEDDLDSASRLLLAVGLAQALGGMRSSNFSNLPESDDYSDDDDDEYGPGILGFSGSDVFELMCQGVKPWDSDAEDVLNALDYY